ncbi:uncharacterized protein PV06_05774 [Exophiala oligosperma]|uniref:endo-1,3(4)-beta-glucanase n=2 Tax=Chaetothyriales TaxID=34395 RepID=A0A0D2E348_9EURO|nr:uncharacterized protein PV06_05774 [Exophiala oligosperma]KAJ9634856.1 hypothetical protein H2204_006090 [Knufia peltigerae]KIW42209.1 hypothetical protein PV06_05774 [Exophiala oligosperma]
MLSRSLIALAGLISLSTAGYVLEDDYSGDQFFSMFDFFTDRDPTNGYVTYVDQTTAQSNNLISTTNGSIYMGVDHSNVASGLGRNSVRLTSTKSYTHGLIILDLNHMPGGVCGTWPAFWTVGANWPTTGEIDIIEGVNSQIGNSMALHTGPGCSISSSGDFSGQISSTNCFVSAPGQAMNAGCQILATNDRASYGTQFNQGQGGVFATEWTSTAINIWFFPRGSVPSDIASGSPDPSSGSWGTPMSSFAGGCTIDNFFSNHQIVFDTTFCGDWAGSVWSTDPVCSSKASTCEDFVQNNPSAFLDAYWSVNSLKVFQNPDGSSSNGTVPGSPPQPPLPPASIPVPIPPYSSGVSDGWPAAAPTASNVPTAGFSRGGNGRFTKTWGGGAGGGWGGVGAAAVATATAGDASQPEITSAPSTGAGAGGQGSFADDSNGNVEYVTVTAMTYGDFPDQNQKRDAAPVEEKMKNQVRDHMQTHRQVHRHLFKHGIPAGWGSGSAEVVEK